MNIAIVRHTIKNRGSDNAFFNYADHLIKRGHAVHYYTNERATDLVYNPAIKFERIPTKGAIGTILFVTLKKFPEDIVAIDLIPLACLAALRNKSKLIYLARGYDVSYFASGLMRQAMRFLYRLALHTVKIPAISVSDALTATLEQFSPALVLTAPNGVDIHFFQKQPEQNTFRKNAGEKIILFHYRDEYVKGSDTGLKSFQRLSELKKDGWALWVIGEELPAQSGVKTVNHGFLNHEKLRDILSAADVFILPSRSEGLSPLLLQALACGCAVVATAASNIIKTEEDGLIAPIEDFETLALQMKRLLEDDGLRSKLQNNARRLAEEYSLEKSCRRFEEALLTIQKDRTKK